MLKVLHVIKYIFLFGIVCLVVTAFAIVVDGLHDNIHKSDAIVILGNKVELTGQPSARLASRLDKGFDLYKEGIAPLIIVTGGIGEEGFDEAKVMKEYLVQKGIPKDLIVEDAQGINTFASAKNVKSLLEQKGLQSVVVVSSYYHISRTVLAFEKMGIESVYSAHSHFAEFRDLYSIPREVIGFYDYLLRK